MNEAPLRNLARITSTNSGGMETAASISYRRSMLSLKRPASQIPTTTASIKLVVSKKPWTVSSSYFRVWSFTPAYAFLKEFEVSKLTLYLS